MIVIKFLVFQICNDDYYFNNLTIMNFIQILDIQTIRIMIQTMQYWDPHEGEFSQRGYVLPFLCCKPNFLSSSYIMQMEISLVK